MIFQFLHATPSQSVQGDNLLLDAKADLTKAVQQSAIFGDVFTLMVREEDAKPAALIDEGSLPDGSEDELQPTLQNSESKGVDAGIPAVPKIDVPVVELGKLPSLEPLDASNPLAPQQPEVEKRSIAATLPSDPLLEKSPHVAVDTARRVLEPMPASIEASSYDLTMSDDLVFSAQEQAGLFPSMRLEASAEERPQAADLSKGVLQVATQTSSEQVFHATVGVFKGSAVRPQDPALQSIQNAIRDVVPAGTISPSSPDPVVLPQAIAAENTALLKAIPQPASETFAGVLGQTQFIQNQLIPERAQQHEIKGYRGEGPRLVEFQPMQADVSAPQGHKLERAVIDPAVDQGRIRDNLKPELAFQLLPQDARTSVGEGGVTKELAPSLTAPFVSSPPQLVSATTVAANLQPELSQEGGSERSFGEVFAPVQSTRPDLQAARLDLPQAPAVNAEKAVLIVREALEGMAAKQQREIELQLHPKDLGRLRFVMSPADGQMFVQVFADRPETLDAMRRHVEILTREFAAEGFGSSTFSFEQGSTGSQPDDNFAEPGEAPPDGPMPQVDVRRYEWGNPDARLDIRI
ncbi:flagellar hook-length control protein FliK [Lentibacter sp.]|uniref:flagellar hook-length control protein FliK n=1 Tax=Lentibacter sp. TaxID=2024994 RepID=UPI003F6BD2EE